MDHDIIYGRCYELRYNSRQILVTKLLFVADFKDLDTICGIFWTQLLIRANFMG